MLWTCPVQYRERCWDLHPLSSASWHPPEVFIPQMLRLEVSLPDTAHTFSCPEIQFPPFFLPINTVFISGAAKHDPL